MVSGMSRTVRLAPIRLEPVLWVADFTSVINGSDGDGAQSETWKCREGT